MKSEPDRRDTSACEKPSTETGNAAAAPVNEASDPGEGSSVAGLTKEEQWALFEKELKESDWGHQPC